ncbi:2,4-dienoyl-CoA reductase-like NADH-dependent reductase (Old Yellow Enzyme family) [Halopolyspora algeriensis]|uniref:2,4-dienoyl-CoA reductase-like NADH-dependent reductase (Old Yellow Enzyme family) n=1 Tax=Halopolyspora algeriensis TaxID=1500506 RepID=A0A368VJ66_9ACTN|nr:NADH:flavin oxidoreductase/NADH oxidase [Halopolyspora algeriensis]RCW40254.1 2,4-dienoyl-CoA reductase-like NADH-dependent reductase (Old Yellow Enzyme family) [Halopolyspora algeriensis]TQM46265.1 2,4-dienoyl-CoA reductase-like NADH-dependent reductase (Old Yellow Enzyme family) [Halopolyspora algeriensis]
MSHLFEPVKFRDIDIRNRAWVSPMCQYSATDGVPDDWHLVHLGQFATGGAGLVFTEATAVAPPGRISPADTGLWNDEQTAAWQRITRFLHDHGSAAGIQLAHAGRKASVQAPWEGGGSISDSEGGWRTVSSTDTAFGDLAAPRALGEQEVAALPEQFAQAARRAEEAGFDVIELHFAHGYLAHQFYSPLVNDRTDRYGGDFDSRVRLLLEITDAVRAVWPQERPLFARISATDWVEGGWTGDDSVRLARLLAERGIDLVDASTGGAVPYADIPVGSGYQVRFARRVRAEAGVPTGAVGLITSAEQAEEIISSGSADAVLLARELLRNPHWPLHAADRLRRGSPSGGSLWPRQYERAARR